jgi:hypothetical protein
MRARRAALHDVFRKGDASVVMAGTNVVRISPLATYLLEQMSDWRTSDELAAALLDQFGSPADGSAADFVVAMLAELATFDIVDVEP